MNLQRREEKLNEDTSRLRHLEAIYNLFNDTDETAFDEELEKIGLESFEELTKEISTLRTKIDKIKQKMNSAENPASNRENKSTKTSVKSIFSIDSYKNIELLVEDVKKKKDEVLKKKHVRKQRKIDMAKRGTAASQERMRIISQLARKEKGNDDFGFRDEDWELYKIISKDVGDSDSELENDILSQCEDILKQYDPDYKPEEKKSPAEFYQIHLAIEQFRALELIFQPSMIGNEESGLTFCLDNVFKQFSEDDQLLLASDILLTGNCAQFRGIYDRIVSDVRSIRPFQSLFSVRIDSDPVLGAWKAAKKWATFSDNVNKCLITKDDYLKNGGEFLNESVISNPYFPKIA